MKVRGAHCFEACKDGSLVIYATMPDGDGEPIRIEPHRVPAVVDACCDALQKKPSRRVHDPGDEEPCLRLKYYDPRSVRFLFNGVEITGFEFFVEVTP